jgi:hypothetical protein
MNELTLEMIYWFYSTPNTISINYYDIDEKCSVVEIVNRVDDYIKYESVTIGNRQKELIYKNYSYYNNP